MYWGTGRGVGKVASGVVVDSAHGVVYVLGAVHGTAPTPIEYSSCFSILRTVHGLRPRQQSVARTCLASLSIQSSRQQQASALAKQSVFTDWPANT